MTVVPLHREWMSVWSGIPIGEAARRWFVEHCTIEGYIGVADFGSEAEAIDEAKGWDLPVVRERL